MPFRKGLTSKFLLYFVLISIVPLGGVSYLAYINGRDAIIKGTLDNLSSTLVLRQAEIDRWLSDTIIGFEDVARTTDLGERFKKALAYHGSSAVDGPLPENRSPGHDVLHDEIRGMLKRVNTLTALNFFELFLLSPRGEVHISTDPDQQTKQKEDRLYYREGLKQTAVQPFYYSVTLGEPAVTISNPVKNAKGESVGVLAGRLRLDRVSRIMEERTGLGESGETYLVNNFHFLMSRTRYGYSMRQGIFTEGVDMCLRDRHTGSGLYVNYKGMPVIGAYHWIDKYNVCMIAEISQEEAFESIQRFRNATILLVFLAIFIISILGVGVARSIIRPITNLKKGAAAIGLGNLDYQFTFPMRDEFADLAAEFNNMRLRLRDIRDREQALSKLKSEFVSVAAHQLRTPLSGIKWALRMLLDGDVGKVTEKQQEFIAKLYANNERMIHLVNDLLNVARIEQSKFDYREEMVDLINLVEDIIAQKYEMARRVRVALDFKPVKEKIPLMMLDPEKMGIAISNVLDNALKYTKKGGSVLVRLRKEKEGVRISIKDTGIGISKSQMSKLYIKFSRGVEAGAMDPEGSGLGLYISKNIIEHYGGKIEIKSEQGKGSVFSLILPLAKKSRQEVKRRSLPLYCFTKHIFNM